MTDPHRPALTLAAVVLAGGTAARMGGADKAALEVGGVTLLDRALAATAATLQTVVVGEPLPTSRPVTWTRERPPGGGPAAGLLAGLDALTAEVSLVAVLAVDMPRFDAGTLARLTWAVERSDPARVDGAVLVDATGRRQTLAAVHRTAALRAARPADPADESGLPVRRLLAPLRLVEVLAVGEEARDVDSWADLEALR